ncbi:MAG: hypothetical protein RKE49_03930 [Oceanicaulis sp.]
MSADDDALKALWRDTPTIDAGEVRARLDATNRLHRRLNQASFALGWLAAAAILAAEVAGRIDTAFAAPILVAAGLIASWLHYRWSKKRLQRAFSVEPRAMLAFAIGRSRAGLTLARSLYLGLPAGVAAGYLGGAAAGGGLALPDGPSGWLLFAGVLAGVALAVTGGVVMARRRAEDIAALKARRPEFEGAP